MKKSTKTNVKFPKGKIIAIVMACCIVLAAVIITIILTNNNSPSTSEVEVKVISPSSNTEGISGSTLKYEVTGASSAVEANQAIIMKDYSDSRYYRVISEQEALRLAQKIEQNGAGVIEEWAISTGPWDDTMHNWHNYYDANGNYIITYQDANDDYQVLVNTID